MEWGFLCRPASAPGETYSWRFSVTTVLAPTAFDDSKMCAQSHVIQWVSQSSEMVLAWRTKDVRTVSSDREVLLPRL